MLVFLLPSSACVPCAHINFCRTFLSATSGTDYIYHRARSGSSSRTQFRYEQKHQSYCLAHQTPSTNRLDVRQWALICPPAVAAAAARPKTGRTLLATTVRQKLGLLKNATVPPMCKKNSHQFGCEYRNRQPCTNCCLFHFCAKKHEIVIIQSVVLTGRVFHFFCTIMSPGRQYVRVVSTCRTPKEQYRFVICTYLPVLTAVHVNAPPTVVWHQWVLGTYYLTPIKRLPSWHPPPCRG